MIWRPVISGSECKLCKPASTFLFSLFLCARASHNREQLPSLHRLHATDRRAVPCGCEPAAGLGARYGLRVQRAPTESLSVRAGGSYGPGCEGGGLSAC